MITIEQCCCGFKGRDGTGCKTYWLVGIGHFCQGSGFTKEEAQRIADALNKQSWTEYLESFIGSAAVAKLAANFAEGKPPGGAHHVPTYT